MEFNHPYKNFIIFPEYPADKMFELRSNLSHFVANNCLREIIEAFSAYLDQIYGSLEIFHNKQLNPKTYQEFTRKDFPIKIKAINERLIQKMPSQEIKFLIALQRLRNCLSHARGIISNPNGIIIKWPYFEIFWNDSEGRKILIDFDSPSLQPIPGGTSIFCKISFDKKIFKSNEIISIDPKQMTYICFGAMRACKIINEKVIKTAQALGFPVNIA
jgi:hypothetical protein